jgi:hypothetical protein
MGQTTGLAGCVVLLALLCACAPAVVEQRPFALGEQLLDEGFDTDFAWESYLDPAKGIDFRIENGTYRARAWDGAFMWTVGAAVYDDVAIQVDTLQNSTYRDNAYGVMCRASPGYENDGYYFMISADAHYTIRRGGANGIEALVQWTPSPALQTDRAINRILAVCIGETLALYVNGVQVGEARDALYRRGAAGLTAGVPDGGEVDITFDNLRVWAASR